MARPPDENDARATTAPGVLQFGDFTLDANRFELRRGADLLHLQPKTFDLLHHLLRHPDRVVEKDELLSAVWPGVVVTEHSLTRCVKDLRKALDDDAGAPRYIETVARRGYRMLIRPHAEVCAIEPPRDSFPGVVAPAADQAVVPQVAAVESTRPLQGVARRKWLWAATAVVGVGVVALLMALAGRSPLPPPPEASIAVLPFVSPGTDDEGRAFADGVAEDLLDRLAQLPQLRVVARTSSFAFRGGSHDARDIGRALGVAWLLEGSARRDGQRIVVTAQLVDTRSGFRAWSERLERPLSGLFTLEDEVAQAITERVARQLAPADLPTDAYRPRDVRAHQAFLLGRDFLYSRPAHWAERAVEAFAQAVALEPGYARGHAGLSIAQSLRASTAADLSAGLALAADHASRALALDPGLGLAHTAQGLLHLQRREFPAAEAALRRALAIDPVQGMAHGWFANSLVAQSRNDESLAALQAGLRIDPLNPTLILDLAGAHTRAGRWDEAHTQLSRLLVLPVVPPTAALRLDGLELERGRLSEAMRWALRIEKDSAEREGALAGIAVAEALVRLGLTEQALERLTRIDIRQPLPAGHLLDLELAWRMLGRPAEAELLSRATLAAASRPWPSWLAEHRARVLMINGRAAEGLALLESSTPAGYDFGGGGPALDGQLLRIWALRQAGQAAEAQALAADLLRALERAPARAGVSTAMQYAMALTLAGQPDKALAVLERENEARRLDPAILLADDPRWDTLRALPRWQTVVRTAGAHQASERTLLQSRLAAGDPAFSGLVLGAKRKP